MAAMHAAACGAPTMPSLPDSEYEIRGIANVLVHVQDGKFWYFGLEGDRRRLTDAQKANFASHFHVMDEVLQGAPHSPYYTKEPDSEGTTLVMCGEKFDKLQVAEAQYKHAISKGWVPLMFGSLADAHKAVTHKEYALHRETLLRFHNLMVGFTRVTEGQRYHEVVMGAREGEEPILETVVRETFEEAGVTIDPANPAIRFVGYSDPFTSRKTGETCVTAIFVTLVGRKATEADFKIAMEARRPTAYEYDCPHAFYKELPVNSDEAKLEKGNLEVVSGAFHQLDLDGALHPNMDFKNKKIMEKVIPYLKALATAPRLERQRAVAPECDFAFASALADFANGDSGSLPAAPVPPKLLRHITFGGVDCDEVQNIVRVATYKGVDYRWTQAPSGFNTVEKMNSNGEFEELPGGDEHIEIVNKANWVADLPSYEGPSPKKQRK